MEIKYNMKDNFSLTFFLFTNIDIVFCSIFVFSNT